MPAHGSGRLFAVLRRLLGRGLTQAEVDVVNASLDAAEDTPPAQASSYDRAKLAEELTRDEDLRLKPYRCTAGALTVGVGRNLDANPITAAETAALGLTNVAARTIGVTREQAVALLGNDMAAVERQLDARLPWWRKLTDARQRVLLNMAFNLGIAGLLGFRNTLRRVEAGDYPGAAAGMRASLWARQVGKRAERLARMMEAGT